MASLEHDDASGHFRIRFRFGGRPFKRSLKTADPKEADATLVRLEENLRLIQRGRLEIPLGADPGAFLLSDGKLNGKPITPMLLTLAELFTDYQAKIPPGVKEPNSIDTEKVHSNHLTRILGANTAAQELTMAVIQDYVQKRSTEKFRDKPITATTIKKETATLRAIWNWAVLQGLLIGPSPTRGVKYPKTDSKPPFRTYGEIKQLIERGRLSDIEQDKLWKALFLTAPEILEVLDLVRERAVYPFIYPMFAFIAFTGARRSEMIRSQIEDIDFAAGIVRIREKKKDRSKTITYRHVEMSPLLRQVLKDWLAKDHPGGPYTIAQTLTTARGKTRRDYIPLTVNEANHHFHSPLAGTKWEVIRGFHVFRHSFASILAAANVDQRVIDEFTGHQTEEMRRRYRHLFPDQRRRAIESVFAGPQG